MALQKYANYAMRSLAGIGAVALAWLTLIPSAVASVYNGSGISSGLSVVSGIGGIAGTASITDLILKIISFVLDAILVVAVLAVIVAGVYLVVSNGDETQKDKAKKIILYVIAGIILILLARVIVVIVNHIF